jgi:undecaprenyl-diphosphatase
MDPRLAGDRQCAARLVVQPAQASPAILTLLRFVTELGSWWFTLLIAAVTALLLLARGERRRCAALVAVVLFGRLSVDLLKLWFDRARPTLVDYDVVTHSVSFPSGHAGNSAITFLAIALITGSLFRNGTVRLLGAAALIFAIGLTRPMLGVHWPTDVLAGWAWGVAWTLTWVQLLRKWMEGQPNARLPRSV